MSSEKFQNTLVNSEFSAWAKGFSGCDGGNPDGKIWICGIEYGGGENDDPTNQFPSAEEVPYVGNTNYPREEFLCYRYNINALKLLAAIAKHNVRDYKEFFKSQSCFSNNSNYFKMNLYPLAFRDIAAVHFDRWRQRTGLASREQYLQWCNRERFPVIRGWVKRHSPTLVICTGKSYANDFGRAFGGPSQENMKKEMAGGKEIAYFLTNDKRTLVAVTYFLGGRYGLSSNERLSETGNVLGSMMNDMILNADAS